MRARAAALAFGAILAAGAAFGQATPEPAPSALPGADGAPVIEIRAAETLGRPVAVLRWLDKVSGETADLHLHAALPQARGVMELTATGCRVPADDPTSDGFAHVVLRDLRSGATLFSGWMVASSPALSALDHARYDVWLLGCATE
ncbi:MAG: DUF2155 domain-containing protein [Alphaproteobacteria bacterium]|nr:DUF2155 domain-containing protein [Alphaproteobacteria bacterium]